MDPHLKSKTCPYCEESFVPKRLNQVYCCITHKVRFNNNKARDNRFQTSEANKTLKKNLAILKTLHKKGNLVWTAEDLTDLNYNFSYYTQQVKQAGKTCYMVYYYYLDYNPDKKTFKIIHNE